MYEWSGYISVGGEKLHYLQWGSGKRLLLAFHGYGDDSNIFAPIRAHLGNEYTMLSIDLPHHGRSKWEGDERFSRETLGLLVRQLMEQLSVEKVSLLGYSMGGRVSLAIIEQMPECIDKVALLATDGLAVNPYYYFFTKTYIGRKVFNNMLDKPGKYIKMVELLKKGGLVNTSRYRFAMHFLGSEDNRKFLQKVWPNTNDLMPSPVKLKALIKKHEIHVAIFMGRHDKIIPPALARRFKRGLSTVQVFELDKGHRLFDDTNAHLVAQQLL